MIEVFKEDDEKIIAIRYKTDPDTLYVFTPVDGNSNKFTREIFVKRQPAPTLKSPTQLVLPPTVPTRNKHKVLDPQAAFWRSTDQEKAAALRTALATSKSRIEASKKLKISFPTVVYYAKKFGVEDPFKQPSRYTKKKK